MTVQPDWKKFKKNRQTPEGWRKDPHCWHEKGKTIYDDGNERHSVCYMCETLLDKRPSSQLNAEPVKGYSPDRVYSLRDMAYFDAFGTITPSQRKAWEAKL